MLLDDYTPVDNASSPVSGSTQFDPKEQLRKMLEGVKETDKQLADLKSRPVPTLSAPVDDKLDPTAIDALRGFFQSSMPQQTQQQDFGDKFRQSISPGREFLANLMGGMSAGFGGAKFQSVRDEAFQRYAQEQKLTQDGNELRQRAMQGVASLAQQVHEQKGKEQLSRDVEMVKIAQTDAQQQAAIMKMQQTGQKFGLDVATELAKLQQEKAAKPDFSDKYYQDASLQMKSQFEKAGRSLDVPVNRADYDQHVSSLAHALRLQDLQDQAANKPDKGDKTATPQLNYIPLPGGGSRVVESRAGSILPPGATSQAGMTSMNIPTSSTRTMIEKAPSVINFVDKIGPQIDSVIKKLGPAAGRWNDFLVGKVGEKDPEMAALRTNISLLETRLMNMHVGARGSTEMMDHFHKLIDISKQDPNNLKSALSEIRDYATSVGQEGGVSDVRKSTSTPIATHRFNPATGKIEEIK